MSAEISQGVFDAALEISARRANTLREIRQLIVEGKKDDAWDLLLKHLGLSEPKAKLKLVKKIK